MQFAGGMVVRRLIILFLLLFAPIWALADAAPLEARWICWIGVRDDYHIHCLRESDPVLEDVDESLREPYDDGRMLGEFFAAGKPRNVTRVVRDAPARYQGILWSIPLYSMPFDPQEVALLARTIMCGTDTLCTVEMNRYERQVAGD